MSASDAAARLPDTPRRLVAAGFASFFPLAVIRPSAAGVVFWLLALAGLAVWARQRAWLRGFMVPRRAALAALVVVPVALNVASKLAWSLSWSAVGWTPLLALVPLAVLLRAAALDLRVLLAGAALGGVAAAGVALVGWLGFGARRADLTLNAILFGQAALTYAAIALLAWRWRLPFAWPALLPAAVLGGLAAFALSGFRGGLLALPLVAVALADRAWRAGPGARPADAASSADAAASPADTAASPADADAPSIDTTASPAGTAPPNRPVGAPPADDADPIGPPSAGADPPARASRRPWRPRAAVLAAAALALGYLALAHSPLGQRIDEVAREVSDFQRGRVERSSVGSRLAMWQAALVLAREHPAFGVGAHRFPHALAALREQGRFPPDVDLFDHAHNTYLTVAAEYGAAGLAAWALALAALWRLLGRAAPPARRLGRCLLAVWLAFALTNDILAHQTTLRLLVALMAGCIGAVDRIAPFARPIQTQPR